MTSNKAPGKYGVSQVKNVPLPPDPAKCLAYVVGLRDHLKAHGEVCVVTIKWDQDFRYARIIIEAENLENFDIRVARRDIEMGNRLVHRPGFIALRGIGIRRGTWKGV